MGDLKSIKVFINLIQDATVFYSQFIAAPQNCTSLDLG